MCRIVRALALSLYAFLRCDIRSRMMSGRKAELFAKVSQRPNAMEPRVNGISRRTYDADSAKLYERQAPIGHIIIPLAW